MNICLAYIGVKAGSRRHDQNSLPSVLSAACANFAAHWRVGGPASSLVTRGVGLEIPPTSCMIEVHI